MQRLTKLSLGLCLFSTMAFGFQETKDVVVTDYHLDHATKMCTMTINKSHHVTTMTNRCHKRKFSWKCFSADDYFYAVAVQSFKNKSKFDIRYSEYGCEKNTGNMKLLTIW